MLGIFWGRDRAFADTQVLARGRVRQPRPRLLACTCSQPHLMRVHREGWMRFVPLLRLYACLDCAARVLHFRAPSNNASSAVYLPAPPLRAPAGRILHFLAKLPPDALKSSGTRPRA